MFLKKIHIGLVLIFASTWSCAFAKNGMFVTVDGGYGKQTTITDPKTINASLSEPFLSSYRAGIGYNHDIFRWLGIGIEVGKGFYARVNYHFPDTTALYEANTTEFLGQLQFHLKRMDFFLKGGGARYGVNVHFFKEVGHMKVNRPEVAMGTAFNFNCHFAPTLTYYHIFGEGYAHLGNTPFDIEKATINAVLLGVRYTF